MSSCGWDVTSRSQIRMIQNDPSLKHSFVVFEIRHHLQNCIGTLASKINALRLCGAKKELWSVTCWPTYRSTLCTYVCVYIYIYILYMYAYIYIYYIYIYYIYILYIYIQCKYMNYIPYIYIKLYTIYCISRDSEREREREWEREREPDIIYDNALHVWSYVYDRIEYTTKSNGPSCCSWELPQLKSYTSFSDTPIHPC